jgi:hypothetical protein
MKKILLLFLSLFLLLETFSQVTNSTAGSKDYYLQNRKNQKITAVVLLGTGIGMTIGGVGINSSQPYIGSSSDNAKGLWLCYIGVASTLTSIPFFISAHKNKKRAASVAISTRKFYYFLQNNFASIAQPTVVIKIVL